MVTVNTNGNSSALIQVRGLDKTYWRGGEQIDVPARPQSGCG